jgi:hypothetical protein
VISKLQIGSSNILSGKAIRNILIGLYILVILGISASAKAEVSAIPKASCFMN